MLRVIPRTVRASHIFFLLAAVLSLGACGDSVAPTIDVDVIGAEAAPFDTGVRLSPAAQLVRAATTEGLVGLDAQGRVIPALADRWIITDDGQSYIFRLRDGTWPDGVPITSENVRQALRQSIAALAGTSLALGAADVEDIRAMAGRVVEIRLNQPMPDLLQLLAQPEFGLARKGAGGGPMILTRTGPLALLSPIPPGKLGLPQPDDWMERTRSIRLHAVPANVAMKRFAAREVDVVLGGRFNDFPLAQEVAGLSQRALRVDPAPGLFGLSVAGGSALLSDSSLREALAMAIDRDALAGALGVSGWNTTARLVPAGADGGAPDGAPPERWAGLTLDQRRTVAATRISRWKAQHGPLPDLRLALPEGPGADALFARLQADFSALGLRTARVVEGAPADLRLLDLVARYGGPEWFLGQLSCAAARGMCNAEADARLAQAREVADPVRRAALMKETEDLLTAANVYIPLGAPIRWSLVRDGVGGFAVNPAAFHPLPPLAERSR